MQEILRERLEQLKKGLFIDEKRAKIKTLEERVGDEDTWKNWEEGNAVTRDLSSLKKDIEDYEMLELMAEEGDNENFERELHRLELNTFFKEKHDKNDAIITVHSGQGGTEAMDWAATLFRMYKRYAEKNDWEWHEVHVVQGDEAGIKTGTVEISGRYAYGFLKNEAGVHRLVRQSPFNADNLRQTSFALVEIIPLINEDIEDIELKEEDLEWDFFRSGGSGGQNVNKVSTAVRLKHKSSGIIVECQEERFQGKNREKALKILKSKLYKLKLEKIEAEKKKAKGDYKMPGWGNQIRNYVLHPYKLVKDLRTDVESTNPEYVLDGGLEEFIDAEIRI
ncbi:peptide chain release factor 2 [candidate division WWE3 bacterium RIFOXYB1_FULL_43_24]|uniref:Peptide chain release factor 2 n=2 Tax=Katanobacteria TaxID=422282 RepID=A0A0G1AT09_UNCKA|nr:MAG: Peptide chain release factor 2 [candidate division WWE3 bacterium GW2011_GWA1_42_12]KKS34017.1 MAG: Peptide chain release factor 2 [candidate division WWE3 bacterium GW2011_GWD1_42_14]KKS37206.1 MAG: Peptide chain release factor 2 [candidate division WWE3 bacterium GW2011_GWF1_42_14]KKS40067.1 MAG: Peptide chain release factor 2 [candidate division WWE3 bacterium GW2011_GWE1_42_16]KKS66751.1 MAG: Peptide chain release factor 2 [candidate division WWE3 bacterium GW2011_GWB1_42_6]OGC6120